jgi:hypothetical protein
VLYLRLLHKSLPLWINKNEMKASEINKKWTELRGVVAQQFDTDLPDIKVMLFLIGVQELGKGAQGRIDAHRDLSFV